ncbi:class 1b ribonucleoside-diphosphate reductase subunit beta [Paenibacillus medicaginis]|uniref:Ribonucleoside-diphosphate reductase subunit beta n=1 Tax=Paenibacillus medicaginis TaxID=1470560 RepID=A0ABV5BV82_9BACL
MNKVFDAANWSTQDDSFTQMFYNQNTRQFWLPEEISLNGDLLTWKSMSNEEKNTYKKALAGLTLLDTEQGNTGMPVIAGQVKGHQRKAVLNFMAMMENAVHAKSYSNIFITLCSMEEIRHLFEWVKSNRYLQKKAELIVDLYDEVRDSNDISLYKAMTASVFLESFLFYSGFYYPLLCYGQGRMMQSGELINLIIRDEAIHGVYVGLLAQEIYNKQSEEVKKGLKEFVIELLNDLYENELRYTEELYDDIGLTHDVKKFIRYNGNKALQNLGFDPYFEDEEVNPVVINGLDTKTKSHDFFSMKGQSYQKAKVEAIKDEDFIFEE